MRRVTFQNFNDDEDGVRLVKIINPKGGKGSPVTLTCHLSILQDMHETSLSGRAKLHASVCTVSGLTDLFFPLLF